MTMSQNYLIEDRESIPLRRNITSTGIYRFVKDTLDIVISSCEVRKIHTKREREKSVGPYIYRMEKTI